MVMTVAPLQEMEDPSHISLIICSPLIGAPPASACCGMAIQAIAASTMAVMKLPTVLLILFMIGSPSYHVKPKIQVLCGFDELLYLLKQSQMGMDIIVSGTE
jgi:hypothetical protein